MPARPLAPWSLIALLLAVPAAAQDAAPAPAPEPAPQAAPETAAPAPEAPAETPAEAPTAAPEPGTAPDAPAGEGEAPLDLSLGETGEPEVGQIYVRERFTDWELRCERAESGEDPCQLYQLLEDQEGNAVAEISLFGLPDGSPAAAGATIITPLMTLLTEQLTIAVDAGTAKRYPFSWCSAIGCIARVGFTEEEVAAFRRGTLAQLTIVPAAAPDQRVDLAVSLAGFTAGFQAADESGPAAEPGQPEPEPAAE